jgi:hypothetical protein
MSLKSDLALLEPLDGPLWRDIMGFMMRRDGPDRGLCDPEVQDHIVGAVGRATKERGWYYSVGVDGNDSIIETGDLLPGASIWDNEEIDQAWSGESEAEAITAAYVAALKELTK